MGYRLIALDLDGTLLAQGPRGPRILPRTLAALQAAQARGIFTVIATGRTVQSAREWSRRIGGGPIVCCNGAAVLDRDGRPILFRAIAPEPLRRLLGLCAEAGVLAECYNPGGILLDRPWAQISSYLRWVRNAVPLHRAILGVIKLWWTNRVRIVRSLRQWAERHPNPQVLKVMIVGEPERLTLLRDQIQRELPGLTIASSARDNVEVTAGGVSKATGLRALGDRLRIPLSEMIAFGDSGNDAEMLQVVGLGVAMGNARERIQAVAKRVTASNEADGIALVLEELGLADRP
jgi:Cof subfamily protein (haloacid dehalogenase superfamily)